MNLLGNEIKTIIYGDGVHNHQPGIIMHEVFGLKNTTFFPIMCGSIIFLCLLLIGLSWRKLIIMKQPEKITLNVLNIYFFKFMICALVLQLIIVSFLLYSTFY